MTTTLSPRTRRTDVGGPAPGRSRRRTPTAYFWMLVPSVALLLAFAGYPLVRTVMYSFTDLNAAGVGDIVGLDNYVRLFEDDLFREAVRVTVVYTVVSVAIEVVLAWGLALLLQGPISRLGHLLRVIIAIPMALCPVVVGIVWRFLFNPQYGWINALLGTPDRDWTGDPERALGVMIFVDVWAWTPFVFMMLSAGLLAIPDDIKEAARLDGANAVRSFWSITLPLMMPVTLVAMLLRIIDAAKAFDLPYALTSGGPGNATTTVGIFLYKRGFAEFQQGYASALAVVFTLALVVFAVVYLGVMRRADRRAGL
ncbi:carbohydrate ABC transporter permease [Jiangella mangrovi]|uniref:ABC-type sugar transport system permease subunit n=1 Tax=Jiangella mangrovi TaxID=1524084 RepID=A0A7W9GWA2_9ACTN|nr:sugar ABC transporter permease [Jiangella mangrovi]MBB5791239.1 ABC-type sugar transport system permease subunit [Jiangella mangrovi]